MTYADDPAGERKLEALSASAPAQPREQFWADTCREFTEMQHPTQQILELYRKFGCRFCPPGRQQVQFILQALDDAARGWDDQHPELFYQTLELNFPELVKRS